MLLVCSVSYSQENLDFMGGYPSLMTDGFRKNSFESNPGNFVAKSDWEFSAIYGADFSSSGSNISNDIFLISLSKKMDRHYFYFRYTPAFKKSFIISAGNNITIDSSSASLKTTINYSEKFGLGYSYSFGSNFSLGFSTRYFEEEMKEDVFNFFIGDTSILTTSTSVSQKKFWRTDFGMNYLLSERIRLNLSSKNLFLLNENGNLSNKHFELKLKKGIIFGLESKLSENLALNFNWDVASSFLLGSFYLFEIFGGKVIGGINITHDQTQNPFINVIMPTVSFSSNLYSVSLSYINYLQSRNNRLSDFAEKGIQNIVSNQFADDKLLLSMNFALSFKHEKAVEFLDVEVTNDIFPTLTEEFVNHPFAIGHAKNLTDKTISVKPISFIPGINNEHIYSPTVEIAPNSIGEVKFFTLISDEKNYEKRKIDNAEFLLFTTEPDYEDKTEKPVLINTKNNWDGKVSNLRYFVYRSFDYSLDFATRTMKNYSSAIDSNVYLKKFNSVKVLFSEFVKNMNYFSDPRTSFEYVQFPKETMERKGGDCDDLSVAFASILEIAGIETAFVDFKSDDGISHVNLLINTGLNSSQAELITQNDKKYFLRENQNGEDEIWIPLETTHFVSFESSWNLAAEKFYREAIENFGLQKGKVLITDIY